MDLNILCLICINIHCLRNYAEFENNAWILLNLHSTYTETTIICTHKSPVGHVVMMTMTMTIVMMLCIMHIVVALRLNVCLMCIVFRDASATKINIFSGDQSLFYLSRMIGYEHDNY